MVGIYIMRIGDLTILANNVFYHEEIIKYKKIGQSSIHIICNESKFYEYLQTHISIVIEYFKPIYKQTDY